MSSDRQSDSELGTDPTRLPGAPSTQVGRPDPSTQPNGLEATVLGYPGAAGPTAEVMTAAAVEIEVAASASTSKRDLESLPDVDPGLYVRGIEIGRGGMGRILAARDRKLRRDVVIKVLRIAHHNARFEREALITARLQHPSIVRVYDAGTLDGEPFYVMEHVRGESLDRVVARCEDARARLALLPKVIAIADALGYAHTEGVIHRDLKPANVLVGEFGETVVIDWGLAKDLRRADHDSLDPGRRVPGPIDDSAPPALAGDLTEVGAVMGTPSYMPPEQARGESADERSDVYAIGAILYAVLSGTPPISGDRALDDARAGGITPLRDRAPETPDELITIVEHAMAFEPGERYATARELADDLRAFAAGKLIARHSYTTGDLIKRWLKRHRAAVAVATTALVVVGVLSFIGVRQLSRERDVAETARHDAETALRDKNEATDSLFLKIAAQVIKEDPSGAIAWLQRLTPAGLERKAARDLAIDAAQRGVAFELAGPRGDIEHVVAVDNATAYTASDDGHVWRWQLNAFSGDNLEGHTGPIEAMAMSPDGWWLATAGTDAAVKIWNLDKVEVRSKPGHAAGVRGLAFSPDGNTVASTGEDRALWLWTVSTGDGRPAIVDTHPLRPVVWSVDGKRLWAGAGDGRVLEYDVVAGKPVATGLRPHGEELRVLALSPDGTRLASGGEDGAAYVWSIHDKRPMKLGSHDDVVRDVVWTPDGKRVVTAGGDARVLVHELETGKTIVLDGHTTGVKDLAISPDGNTVAVACIDGKVRLWPITGGAPRVLVGHRASVKTIAFTPDGTKLLSGSDDDRMRLWPLLPPPAPPSTGKEFAA